jgi:hypothetical protein
MRRSRGDGSLDDPIRPQQQRRRNREPERFGGLHVDDELELGRLLDRKIPGVRPLEDHVDVVGGAAPQSVPVRLPE